MNADEKKSTHSQKNIILPFLLTLSLYVTSIASTQNNDPSTHKTEELNTLSCHQEVSIKEDKAMYNDQPQDGVNGTSWIENKIDPCL